MEVISSEFQDHSIPKTKTFIWNKGSTVCLGLETYWISNFSRLKRNGLSTGQK